MTLRMSAIEPEDGVGCGDGDGLIEMGVEGGLFGSDVT